MQQEEDPLQPGCTVRNWNVSQSAMPGGRHATCFPSMERSRQLLPLLFPYASNIVEATCSLCPMFLLSERLFTGLMLHTETTWRLPHKSRRDGMPGIRVQLLAEGYPAGGFHVGKWRGEIHTCTRWDSNQRPRDRTCPCRV
jgi:hypothetical protein